jgi:hypothetical protein
MFLCLYQRNKEGFSIPFYFPPNVTEMLLEVIISSLISISDSSENNSEYIRVLLHA